MLLLKCSFQKYRTEERFFFEVVLIDAETKSKNKNTSNDYKMEQIDRKTKNFFNEASLLT